MNKTVTHRLGLISLASEVFIKTRPSWIGVYRKDYDGPTTKSYYSCIKQWRREDPEAEEKAQEFLEGYAGEDVPITRFPGEVQYLEYDSGRNAMPAPL